MREYIEKEAACEALAQDYAYAAAEIVKNLPAADVTSVVHARWIAKQRQEHYPSCKKYDADYCSACGKRGEADFNFCPHCGSRMDVEESK